MYQFWDNFLHDQKTFTDMVFFLGLVLFFSMVLIVIDKIDERIGK